MDGLQARRFSALCISLLPVLVFTSWEGPDVTVILRQMTVMQKIGQMTMLDIGTLVRDGTQFDLDEHKMDRILGYPYFVGNIIPTLGGCECTDTSCVSGHSQQVWRNLTNAMTSFSMCHSNIHPPPPLLFGLDSTHGAGFLDHAVWFQHNIGLSAMHRPDLISRMATVASLDTRAAGAQWQFAPVLGLGMDPRWSRFYETPGESPWLGSVLAQAYLDGVHDASAALHLNYSVCEPVVKHYMGYSAPRTGKDRTDAWIPDHYLKQYFQPSFEAAVQAGARSVMANSGSVNGVPVTASRPLLTGILRQELGCEDCVVVTDWQDIIKLSGYHALAPTMADAIVLALEAGVDMSMVPGDTSFSDTLFRLVLNGTVPESRLDESVTRILKLKLALGLFQDPTVPPQLEHRPPWQQQDVDLALDIAMESMTLLKNEPTPQTGGLPVLPLTGWLPPQARMLVVGPAAVDVVSLCGGWTVETLDGGNGRCGYPQTNGGSIGDGLSSLAPAHGVQSVTVLPGCGFDTPANASELARVVQAALDSHVIVLAMGEGKYQETSGDVQDLNISPAQLQLFSALEATGVPIVTVLVEGRPRVLQAGGVDIAASSAAILMAYLPCFMGGQAIAETLFGVHNPSGRLPFTYPRTTADLDVHFHKPWDGTDYEGVTDSTYHDPLFPFGWGLGYSPIVYSSLDLQPDDGLQPGDVITLTVNLTNTGTSDAHEAVLLYIRQLFRPSVTPEAALLHGSVKVPVPSGRTVTATLHFNTSALAYWSPSLDRRVDAGVYNVTVGNLTAQFELGGSARAEFLGDGQWAMVRHQPAQHDRSRAPGGDSSEDFVELLEQAGLLDSSPLAKSVKKAKLQAVLQQAGMHRKGVFRTSAAQGPPEQALGPALALGTEVTPA